LNTLGRECDEWIGLIKINFLLSKNKVTPQFQNIY
jgi:hypothetical protein